MASIYRENQAYFNELQNVVIAYVQYVNSGGTISSFSELMENKTIDLAMKIKANRDKVDRAMNKPVIQYNEAGDRVIQ